MYPRRFRSAASSTGARTRGRLAMFSLRSKNEASASTSDTVASVVETLAAKVMQSAALCCTLGKGPARTRPLADAAGNPNSLQELCQLLDGVHDADVKGA